MVWDIFNPWWLAVGLGVLVILAMRLARAHVSRLWLLVLELLVILAISVYLIGLTFGYSPANLLAWLIGVALALLMNDFAIRSPRGVFFVHAKKRFIFPGSWIPLLTILALVVLYYGVRLSQSWQLSWLDWPYAKSLVCLLYGVLGGMFLALFMVVLRSQKERSIGTNSVNQVMWTVAKHH